MNNVGERKQPLRSRVALCLVRTLVLSSLAVAGSIAPTGATAASPDNGFGTLFYSPQERASISAARRVVPGGSASSGTTISVGGLVRRDKGKGSAWINGQLVPEGQAVQSAGIPAIDKRDITIEGHRVRVRETVDIESGARVDALPAGSVNVKAGK
ncbi:MAG: hypothetical protein IPM03_03410 [Sulfuritalea sp.]|nr:hypothetical protein [Sulfuritalea sp.]